MRFPVLTSDRLLLRPLGEQDVEALHVLFSDPVLMHWWSSPPHRSLEETRAYLLPDHARSDSGMVWAITTDGGPALGRVRVEEKRPGVWEVGYLLRRDLWGAGLARESVGAVVDHPFASRHARRIFADVDPENAASLRLLERLGFRREGLLRQEWETHLGIRDSVILGLLGDEWRARRRSG